MNTREFKKDGNIRLVMASAYRLHVYHPECAPEGAESLWVKTQATCCHGCHKPIWKAATKEAHND